MLILNLPDTFFIVIIINCAPVAQLDRASDFESAGPGFESLRARHKNNMTMF